MLLCTNVPAAGIKTIYEFRMPKLELMQ